MVDNAYSWMMDIKPEPLVSDMSTEHYYDGFSGPPALPAFNPTPAPVPASTSTPVVDTSSVNMSNRSHNVFFDLNTKNDPSFFGLPHNEIDMPAPSFKQSIFDGPNLLNASITTLFGTLAAFSDVWSSRKLFDLYKEQEQLYLENATLQANRLKRKGEIALANLMSKHAITEGQNELAVVGAGAGAMSGSFVDKLMANRKYDTREEFAQELETQYAISNAKLEGYTNAYRVASAAYSKAIGQRNDGLAALFKGLERGVTSILNDMQAEDATQSSLSQTYKNIQQDQKINRMYYQNNITERKSTYVYADDLLKLQGVALDSEGNVLNKGSFDKYGAPTKLEIKDTYNLIKPEG